MPSGISLTRAAKARGAGFENLGAEVGVWGIS
jgi:hypothetical protein